MKMAEAWAPLTCGELVQGELFGQPFLVTCPIDRFAHARVALAPQPPDRSRRNRRWKADLAVRRTLAHLGWSDRGYAVHLCTPAPAGKGLGTSTADITAAAAAAAWAAGADLAPETLFRIALSVEPSDGLVFPGITLVDHVTGRQVQPLGPPPALDVLVLDPGGRVDTRAFNRRPDLSRLNRAKEPLVREALALVQDGLRRGDARQVAAGATLSARAHQHILRRPYLDHLLVTAGNAGAAGVVAAHSGTAAGVLVVPPADRERVAALVRQAFPGFGAFWASLCGGGVHGGRVVPHAGDAPAGKG